MRGPLITITLIVLALVGVYFFFGHQAPPAEPGSQSAQRAGEPAGGPDGGNGNEQAESLVEEAETYISKLTEPDSNPVAVEKADHFVSKDQVLSLLPEGVTEEITRENLATDPDLSPDTPITVVKKAEQIEFTTPEKVIAEAEGDLDRKVRILEEGDIRESTARELLEQYRQDPDAEIAVVKDVEYFVITTPKELLEDPAIEAGETLTIIRKPYHLEAATIADLLREQRALSPDSVFYVRTVRPNDTQGIWGIVHDGLIENFARGMAIRRGEEINTYQVEIPRDADERLADQSSSFLGKMIYQKTMDSYVYNYKQNRMGRNPDRVIPGQEIVIINFHPDELIDIYKHFASQQG
jgi:hypothetical protein